MRADYARVVGAGGGAFRQQKEAPHQPAGERTRGPIGDATSIIFLLGSGISKPAGMPLGDDITQRVLSGHQAARYNDDLYEFGPSFGPRRPRRDGSADEHVWRIVAFLQALKAELEAGSRPTHSNSPNYEELFDATAHILAATRRSRQAKGEWALLAAKLNRDLHCLWHKRPGELSDRDLGWLSRQAATYIHCFVAHLLDRPPARLDHLDWVADACADRGFGSVDLFTLNHDTLLEASLDKAGIAYTDGFGPQENDLRHWDLELYQHPRFRVRLVKLHGSVNCFMFRSRSATGEHEYVPAIRSGARVVAQLTGHGGRAFGFHSSLPMLLIGIDTKVSQYGSWFFRPLFDLFKNSLASSSVLVVCGYGFRDPGVNSFVSDWLERSSERRMVVLHGKPCELEPALSPMKTRGTVEIVEKWVEDVTWQGLKSVVWR